MDQEKAKTAGRLMESLNSITQTRETLRQWKNNFPRSMELSSNGLGRSFNLSLAGFDPGPIIRDLISQADQRIRQIEKQIDLL